MVIRVGDTSSANLRLMLYSNTGTTQKGPSGTWVGTPNGDGVFTDMVFPVRNEDETLVCDVKSPDPELNRSATIIPNLIENVMGKATGLLDATELANLATDRTQVLKMFIDHETTFGDVLGKLEAGQLWKWIRLNDGTYGTVVGEAGEPANTPHFRDQDFLSFKMELDQDDITQAVTVLYDEDPVVGDFKSASASSDVAKFFYMREDSMEVETFLSSGTDAATLAADYLARFEVPIITAIFEVHAKGIELLPWRDKVKLTRTRAAYAGGTLAGVLFRIVKMVKKPETNAVEITACVWGNSPT